MWRRILGPDRQRRRLHAKAPAGPYRDYLAHPYPDPGADFRQLDYLALDLETTGLSPSKDEILSVGFVVVRKGIWIDLSSARHRLVVPQGQIPEHSAVIHRITDDRAATGRRLRAIMGEVLEALAGRVLLAHHARVEHGFLDRACRRLYGGPLPVPVADTQVLARRVLDRSNQSYGGGDLRLAALRDRYHLPRYPAHNALSDALAAAELFLALTARHDPGHKVASKRILARR
jgi:DNA polymerase-3 subunit epsilon